MDKFCDILPKFNSPRKRSASARLDKLSFLTEISDEALKHYTSDQLKTVLAQRARVSHWVGYTTASPCFFRPDDQVSFNISTTDTTHSSSKQSRSPITKTSPNHSSQIVPFQHRIRIHQLVSPFLQDHPPTTTA